MKLPTFVLSLSVLLLVLLALPKRFLDSCGEWVCDHFHERHRGWPNSGTQVCFKCHRVRNVEWGSPDVYPSKASKAGR